MNYFFCAKMQSGLLVSQHGQAGLKVGHFLAIAKTSIGSLMFFLFLFFFYTQQGYASKNHTEKD